MANITFVDKQDRVIGHGTRNQAITESIIHRIVRIFLFNSKGELLIQKRSAKVDISDRWDQSAAGHVDEGENYITAAKRELSEEIGVINTELKQVKKYYSEETDDGVFKKRFNMLYSAMYDGDIRIDQDEVSEARWINPLELRKWMYDRPEDFTQGFLESYQKFVG